MTMSSPSAAALTDTTVPKDSVNANGGDGGKVMKARAASMSSGSVSHPKPVTSGGGMTAGGAGGGSAGGSRSNLNNSTNSVNEDTPTSPTFDLNGVNTKMMKFERRHQGSRQFVVYVIAVSRRAAAERRSSTAEGGVVLSTGKTWEVERRSV
jgi:hypothetical protein